MRPSTSKWLVVAVAMVSTLCTLTTTEARPELFISNDARSIIDIGQFGFLAGGKLSLDMHDLKTSVPDADHQMGFYIQKTPFSDEAIIIDTECFLDSEYFKGSLEEDRAIFLPLDETNPDFTYDYTIQEGEQEMWSIAFITCKRSLVSFRLVSTEINPGNNFLGAGDIPLPKVYLFAAASYFLAGGVWGYILYGGNNSGSDSDVGGQVKKVFWPHRLGLLLAFLIGIQKTLHAIRTYYAGQGIDSEGWTIMYYIFLFLKGSLHILIITLIASGWMFIKPFLNEKDKKIILVIVPLQLILNIATVISEEAAIGSVKWAVWREIRPMVDLISCIVILGVIIQTQRHLSEAAETEGKVAESKTKYKLWGSFYLVTVIYIYLTRFMVEFLRVALPFQYVTWLVELISELITLGFYITVGWKFRPYANNPYTLLDEDEDELLFEDRDLEASNLVGGGGETVGLQRLSRREDRVDGSTE